MMKVQKVTELSPGEVVFGFGEIYHVWQSHYKMYVACLGRKVQSFHLDETVVVQLGYAEEVKLESDLAFRGRLKALWAGTIIPLKTP